MATVHEENERKYDGALDRPLSAADLPQVARVRAGGTRRLDAVYFDTAGLRLLHRGITLRRRTGGEDAGWHLKIPAADGTRTEVRLPLECGDLQHLPREMAARTRAAAHGEPVAPVAHLRTRRDLVLLTDEDDRTLAELARDTVSAQVLGEPARAGAGAAPAAVTSWVETEVELVDGGPDLLDEVEAELHRRGMERSVARSKLGRVLAAGPDDTVGRADRADRADRAGLTDRAGEAPAGSVGAALTAYLRSQYALLRDLDPAVRLDEPDSVHRMRVQVRRLRSALAAHHRILDRTAVDPLDRDLRWLGRLLGSARDAEVLGDLLAPQAERLPPAGHPAEVGARIRTWFDARYRESHRAVVHAMEGARYFGLLDALERLASAPPLNGRATRGKAEGRRMLRKQQRRTGRRLRGALALPPGAEHDRELHRARKAAKRTRYAAESVTPLVGRRAVRVGRRTKRIQKPLGAHQDGVMGAQALVDIAAADPHRGETAFGLGMLHARQRADDRRRTAEAAKAAKRLDD